MKNKNFYEILGLNPDATKDEIRLSFRKLVRIYHPDVNKTKEAETFFKMLNNAVETLLDDAKRLQYDRLAGISTSQNDHVQKNNNTSYQKSETDINNLAKKSSQNKEQSVFYTYKTGKNTINTAFLNNQNAKNTERQALHADESLKNQSTGPKLDGKDIETVVEISKTEQTRGTIRKINVLHTDKCPKCLGRKYINGTICALCRGAGEKSDHKIMNVKIPAGIKNGVKMKIKNEGEYGKFGGKNGDLYLLIKICADVNTKYQKNEVVLEVVIPPWKAVLGGEAEIFVEGKNVKFDVPPLTKSMTRFKLKDRAQKMPSLTQEADYTVVLKVEIPENLTGQEVLLYEKLREIDWRK